MAKRVSISSSQAQEGAAADLVALLQSTTADGKITTAEIKELHRWIRQNSECGLPAMHFLKETIESICADGRVSDVEREELAKAIERVLPPEMRDFARQRRRLGALAEKERRRQDAQAAAIAEAAAAARRAPIFEFDFLVAGVAYEQRSLVTETMSEDERVFIVRDRANRHSPNAIEVRTTDGFHIGFVPETDAKELAPYLDQGYRHIALVKSIWRGRSIPTPVVIAEIYPPDTERSDAVRESEVPARQPIFQPRRSPLIPVVAVIAALFVIAILILARA
jgi:hypothetical protein